MMCTLNPKKLASEVLLTTERRTCAGVGEWLDTYQAAISLEHYISREHSPRKQDDDGADLYSAGLFYAARTGLAFT